MFKCWAKIEIIHIVLIAQMLVGAFLNIIIKLLWVRNYTKNVL